MGKKILILSDSLALPRKEPEICSFVDTWPQLLRKEGFDVHQVSIGGATSFDLLKQCIYHFAFDPDIVLIQVGIVDCAPRFMTKFELAFCGKIPFFGKKIITLLNRKWVKRLRRISYVKPNHFSKNINDILKYFSNAQVYFLGILPAPTEYEEILPGVKNKIKQYNRILEKSGYYVSLADFDFSGIMSDFHHLNSHGHKFIYDRLKATILLGEEAFLND